MGTYRESKASGKIIRQERKRIAFFGLPLSFTRYILTEKKLILCKGLFTSTEDEILLYRVIDITRKRTLIQKMFGLGTVLISAQDKTIPNLEIKNIKNSDEFRDLLSEQIEHEKARLNVRHGEYVSPSGHDLDSEFDPHDMEPIDPDFKDGF